MERTRGQMSDVRKYGEPMFRLYDMKVVCAWCGKYLDTVKALSPEKISHGICVECSANLLKEYEEYKAAERKVA